MISFCFLSNNKIFDLFLFSKYLISFSSFLIFSFSFLALLNKLFLILLEFINDLIVVNLFFGLGEILTLFSLSFFLISVFRINKNFLFELILLFRVFEMVLTSFFID